MEFTLNEHSIYYLMNVSLITQKFVTNMLSLTMMLICLLFQKKAGNADSFEKNSIL